MPQLGSQEGAKGLHVVKEVLGQILAQPDSSVEGVLDRHGPVWDMIRPHRLND
jgi:hypothetical protein